MIIPILQLEQMRLDTSGAVIPAQVFGLEFPFPSTMSPCDQELTVPRAVCSRKRAQLSWGIISRLVNVVGKRLLTQCKVRFGCSLSRTALQEGRRTVPTSQ